MTPALLHMRTVRTCVCIPSIDARPLSKMLVQCTPPCTPPFTPIFAFYHHARPTCSLQAHLHSNRIQTSIHTTMHTFSKPPSRPFYSHPSIRIMYPLHFQARPTCSRSPSLRATASRPSSNMDGSGRVWTGLHGSGQDWTDLDGSCSRAPSLRALASRPSSNRDG